MLSKVKKGIHIFCDEGLKGILKAYFVKGAMKAWLFDLLFITKEKLGREERRQIRDFKAKQVLSKTVLVVEACDHHCECLPTFVYLFDQLGYAVDVVITHKEYAEKPLEYLDRSHISCVGLSRRAMREILRKDVLDKYDFVLFNSTRIYLPKYSVTPTVFQMFSGLKEYQRKFILVEHAPELLTEDEVKQNHIIIIADLDHIYRDQLSVVIPDFFGNKFLERKMQKSEETRFISIGALNAGTRNPQLIIRAIDYLHEKNIYNFKIIIIGREGNVEGLREEHRKHICFLGRLNYPDMFDEVRKADYFLPLLDPDNETHLQYNTKRSSGSFQLIYGFRIPCVIENAFAQVHGFTDENSIVYSGNNGFGVAMETAIAQNSQEYGNMVMALDKLANHLEESSLQNLSKIIDTDRGM